ncbi:MAG: hypothetical protein WCA01_00025 [Burkholderiales bacterium]
MAVWIGSIRIIMLDDYVPVDCQIDLVSRRVGQKDTGIGGGIYF